MRPARPGSAASMDKSWSGCWRRRPSGLLTGRPLIQYVERLLQPEQVDHPPAEPSREQRRERGAPVLGLLAGREQAHARAAQGGHPAQVHGHAGLAAAHRVLAQKPSYAGRVPEVDVPVERQGDMSCRLVFDRHPQTGPLVQPTPLLRDAVRGGQGGHSVKRARRDCHHRPRTRKGPTSSGSGCRAPACRGRRARPRRRCRRNPPRSGRSGGSARASRASVARPARGGLAGGHRAGADHLESPACAAGPARGGFGAEAAHPSSGRVR